MYNGDTREKTTIEPRRLLAEIARLQAASARALARRLSMPLAAVGEALTRLEVAGLIHASYLDGVDDQYSLSPAGHAWLEREEAPAPRQRA
jgi:DNA-binding transcriptional ArsR family regulator